MSVTNHEIDTGFLEDVKALGFSLVFVCVLLVIRLNAVAWSGCAPEACPGTTHPMAYDVGQRWHPRGWALAVLGHKMLESHFADPLL